MQTKKVDKSFSYALVKPEQKPLLKEWLAQDHINEWLHGAGLQNTLDSIDAFGNEPTIFQHWLAYYNDIPFAYLLTSEVQPGEEEYSPWLKTGRAITLDLFIGDKNFLGRGLAAPMIRGFLLHHFHDVKTVFIDPEASNSRAVHVYQKAGFNIVGEFIASWHPVKHYRMALAVADL